MARPYHTQKTGKTIWFIAGFPDTQPKPRKGGPEDFPKAALPLYPANPKALHRKSQLVRREIVRGCARVEYIVNRIVDDPNEPVRRTLLRGNDTHFHCAIVQPNAARITEQAERET
jgi:hypothetical protein